MFGAACFGSVIGFVAWHVFRAGEHSLDVKQLAAFIAALLGAVVLSAFPAGTRLFAAYACGLAAGFFLVPLARAISSTSAAIFAPPAPTHTPECGDFPAQLAYITDHWPEVERVVISALDQRSGTIREWHLMALPLDISGRIAVLQRYARKNPERSSVRLGILGLKLRRLEGRAESEASS
jgi:hypothetical protein